MTRSEELIVLGHTKFRDNSIVLHCFGRNLGRRGFLVKVGKQTGMSMFLPLSLLEADVSENPKSALWFARNFSSLSPLSGIRSDVRKNAITMFMAEVLFRILKEGVREDGLFEWCSGQILTLNALESDFSNFHLLFLLDLASALGFRPSVEALAPFAGQHMASLSSLMNLPPEQALLFPLSGTSRKELCESVLAYLRSHTDSAIRIKSLDVLHELFR